MERQRKKLVKAFLMLLLLCISKSSFSQIITLDTAIAAALRGYPSLLQSQTQLLQQQQSKKSSFAIPNPEIGIEIPAYDFSWSISQNLEFPIVYFNQAKLGKANVELAQQNLVLSGIELRYRVETAFLQLQYTQSQTTELKKQDSLFLTLSNAGDRRSEAGEIGLLEKLNANNAYQNKHNLWLQSQADFETAQKQLLLFTGMTISNPYPAGGLAKFAVPPAALTDSSAPVTNPFTGIAIKNSLVAQRNWDLEKSKALPGIFGTYLSDNGNSSLTPTRLDVGITLPLWFWQYAARMKSAKYQWKSAEYQMQATALEVNSQWQQALSELKKFSSSLNYYETSAIPQANKIIDASNRSYNAGEIGYVELLQNLNTAFQTSLDYLNAVKDFNLAIIQIHKLSGQ